MITASNKGVTMMNEIAKQNLIQLEATLAAMTGSAGTGELSDVQIDAMLTMCHRLAFDALQAEAEPA